MPRNLFIKIWFARQISAHSFVHWTLKSKTTNRLRSDRIGSDRIDRTKELRFFQTHIQSHQIVFRNFLELYRSTEATTHWLSLRELRFNIKRTPHQYKNPASDADADANDSKAFSILNLYVIKSSIGKEQNREREKKQLQSGCQTICVVISSGEVKTTETLGLNNVIIFLKSCSRLICYLFFAIQVQVSTYFASTESRMKQHTRMHTKYIWSCTSEFRFYSNDLWIRKNSQ